MYKLSLVKKKKKIRRAAIITSIGAIGVTAMVIVAFLGKNIGTFTVNLHGDGVQLALSEHSSFEDQTTNLVCRDLKPFSGEFTYSYFTGNFDFATIHSEDSTSKIGQETYGGKTTTRFFKYTFFIKNVGEYAASYDMDINLIDITKPTNDAAPLDEYLRLAIFDGEENFDPTIYAKRSYTKWKHDEGSCKEYITVDDPKSSIYKGEAEKFIDDKQLAKITDDIADHKKFVFSNWTIKYDPIPTTKMLER